jgi:hypothetical protein
MIYSQSDILPPSNDSNGRDLSAKWTRSSLQPDSTLYTLHYQRTYIHQFIVN